MSVLATRSHAEQPVTTPRRGRRLQHLALRTGVGLASLVVVAVAATAVLDALDTRRAAPGELVELSDGRLLHLEVAGEKHDGPTVVLEAGQGMFSPALAWLKEEISTVATVVAYDRPGYGWSDAANRPVTAAATAADLHQALAARDLPGPYILVGHSLGAMYVRVFAERFPDEIAGLVLLDPAHEHQLDRLPADAADEMAAMSDAMTWAARLARLGVFRLYNPNSTAVADLPAEPANRFAEVSARSPYWRTAGAEATAFEAVAAEVPPALPQVPVAVVTAPVPEDGREQVGAVMDTLNRELAASSEFATHHVIAGADHLSLITNADHARSAAQVVKSLLEDLDSP